MDGTEQYSGREEESMAMPSNIKMYRIRATVDGERFTIEFPAGDYMRVTEVLGVFVDRIVSLDGDPQLVEIEEL